MFYLHKINFYFIVGVNQCQRNSASPNHLDYKFVYHSLFIEITFQFFTEDLSHTTSRQPKSRFVFLGRPSVRSQNRLSHHVNVLGWFCYLWEARLFLSLHHPLLEVVYPWNNQLPARNATIWGHIESFIECTLGCND